MSSGAEPLLKQLLPSWAAFSTLCVCVLMAEPVAGISIGLMGERLLVDLAGIPLATMVEAVRAGGRGFNPVKSESV